jgi:hypothetical protein
MRLYGFRAWGPVLLGLSLFAASVWAEPLPALIGKVKESFDKTLTQTSASGFLTGVYIGAMPEYVEVGELKLFVESENGTALCFSAVSQDGAYFADGLLRAPSGVRGWARLDDGSRFPEGAAPLRGYRPGQFAALVHAGNSCQGPTLGKVYPLYFNGPLDRLDVAMNSNSAVSVEGWLITSEGLRLAGQCTRVEGRATGFGHRCVFDRKGWSGRVAGHVRVVFQWQPRAGPRREIEYELALPLTSTQ